MKALLILIFVMFSSCLWGQNDTIPLTHKNGLTVIMQMDSWSFGVRYERRWEVIGFYAYTFKGDFPESPCKVDDEFTVGVGALTNLYVDYNYRVWLSAGGNYSKYTYYPGERVETSADDPYSLDLGISAQHGWANFGFKIDVNKWKPAIYFGFNF
jgi:hypothetical protein